MNFCIGIDIGGTKCAVILAHSQVSDPEKAILGRTCFQTDPYNPQLNKICEAIDSLLSDLTSPADCLDGIGISCGSPLDPERGIIQAPPNLPGWIDVPIGDVLRSRYQCPVVLENDANACAVAEWKFGAGRGTRNMIFLTFGTGMGAGLILDGRLYRGACNMAGEVGHIAITEHGPVGYGRAGSFEGYCSGGGLARLAQIRLTEALQIGSLPAWCPTADDISAVTAKSVAEAAQQGDLLAAEIYAESARALGKGLSLLIDILNPEAIVIGSVYERSTALFHPYVDQELIRNSLACSREACRILPATLGDRIGDLAAISLVSNTNVTSC